MDVRLRFNMPAREYDNRTCIIVLFVDEIALGLIVDKVAEVLDIPSDKIQPPPHSNDDEGNRYIKGMSKMGDDVHIILDSKMLIFESM